MPRMITFAIAISAIASIALPIGVLYLVYRILLHQGWV